MKDIKMNPCPEPLALNLPAGEAGLALRGVKSCLVIQPPAYHKSQITNRTS